MKWHSSNLLSDITEDGFFYDLILLDNALEAAENAEGNLRFISLTIRRINEMLIIKLENGCKTAPVITAGELKITKQDLVISTTSPAYI